MSEEMMQTSPFECPAWFDGKKINETVFCEEFLRDYPMVTVNDAFFTVNGRVHDENRLKKVIYDRIKYYVTSGVAKKVTNLLDVMRMECCTAKLSLYQDRIHVANGTYYLNGTFSPEKDFCRNRLPVAYNPDAPQPVTWLHFLMANAQYAILRFAKYKGPEISGIEAHNERTKEKYASNPDIDPSRTHLNFHLIKPERKYRAESECQIAEAGCRTRSDSVRVVEALITATPEFFKGKKRAEIREFFNEALEFIKQNQAPETIISAVVHLDEKSPHMHLCFVPLTEDKRLCAKEILGNKKKLTQWQDKYWEHMVKKYPDLERGESASETGRDHIPTRVFKQMARLNKQHDKLAELLSDMKFTNYKERSAQIAAFLEKYIPDVAAMETQMKKYKKFFKTADGKQKTLEKKNDELTAALEKSEKESTVKKLQEMRLHSDYERIKGILDRIPPEIIRAYTHRDSKTQEVRHYR